MTFLRYFPDIKSLARSSEEEVLKVWQGLGYYSRALNMHSAAKSLVKDHKGKFPQTYDGIRNMRGVGDYTAAAIASISFGLPHAAVDGNVKRVASRIFGIDTPIQSASTVKEITDILNSAIVNFAPGEFNQAMMELGAMVCKPKNPLCSECPVNENCYANINKMQSVLPVQIAKRKPVEIGMDYLFLEDNGNTWLIKRDKKSIWKGLFEFPVRESRPGSDLLPSWVSEYVKNPAETEVLNSRSYTHKLTHRTIFARFWHLCGKPSNIVMENKDFIQIKTTELGSYPIHRLMHRYLSDSGLI